MPSTNRDLQHTLSIARRALERIQTHGPAADPRSYEVWYTFESGHNPGMSDAVKRLTSQNGKLRDQDIDSLHEAHLDAGSLPHEAVRTSCGVIEEIDRVMTMIDTALGSTARYGESLANLSDDLAGPFDRARLREMIDSLALATKEVALTNHQLENGLKETRGEVATLRENLEAARLETLTDPLTGISNRKHFEETLIRAIDEAASTAGRLSLIVIDIDHFKYFNDTYGHLTGDQVLRLVTATMREKVANGATLARFGGEEFGIVLPGLGLAAAREIAERIRLNVMSRDLVKRSTGESLGRVTVSVGVASHQPGDTALSLLDRADQCMFAAKSAGRNCTVLDAELVGSSFTEVA